MALTTKTTMDDWVPTVWSGILNSAREKKMVFPKLFDHRWEAEFEGQPLDHIFVHGLDNYAQVSSRDARAYSAGLDPLLTDAAVLVTRVDIPVTRHYYRSFAVTHDAEMLSKPEVTNGIADKASYAVALEMDAYMSEFVDDFTQAVGTLGVATSDEDVIRGTQYLNDADAPFDDRFYVFSMAEDANYKKIEKYINADYGAAVGNIDTGRPEGQVANIHGLTWISNNHVSGANSTGHDNGMWHRSAVAVVIKEDMRVEGPSKDLESDSTEMAMHSYYGAVQMRGDHGVFVRGL